MKYIIAILLTLLAYCWINPATAAIAHRDTQSNGTTGTSNAITSVDAAAGSDLAIVVTVSYKDNGGGEVTGVVWDAATANEAFTQIGGEIKNGEANLQMWLLVAPTSKTATVTISTTNSVRQTGVASVYTGVHQTVPTDTGNINSANGSTETVIGYSVTAQTDQLIVHGGAQVSAGPDTVTANTGTLRATPAATGGGTDTRGMYQDKVGTGSLFTMSFTMSAADNWAILYFVLRDTTYSPPAGRRRSMTN